MLFQDYVRCDVRNQQLRGRGVSVEFPSSDAALVVYGKECIRYDMHKEKTAELQKKVSFPICVYQINTKGKNTYEIVFAHKDQETYFRQTFQLWTHANIVEWYATKLTETSRFSRFTSDETQLIETIRNDFLSLLEEDPVYRLWFVTNQVTIKCS